eukprot:TRINITY_DN44921_c0_g1_i1.p1 TRINITY_DN44921_c0_g1~~TRINITY_DN44921_c0_g1_i1.p1  ORF type:complete len:102 (-),score=4.95 TRINITY_DN44921_c0_g1_i1:534-839(-)
MEAFSNWIDYHYLIDLQLEGNTWSNHQNPPTLSRLDRSLVTDDWIDLYPQVCQIALPKPTFDHCPILLDSRCVRWGPYPFRFELMWLEDKEFSAPYQGLVE